MKELTRDELIKILENHKHFLKRDVPNWQSMRADLSFTNLSGANLVFANLARANLHGANLSGANLLYAILNYSDLSCADLSRANLACAELYHCNLLGSRLIRADLSYSDLSWAELSCADLREVNLRGANLYSAITYGSYICNARNIPYIPMVCPEEGEFIAYKKARSNIILKLLIPEDAKRCSGISRKCRCNKAIVLEMQNCKGEIIDVKEAYSIKDPSFTYRIGETVEVSDFDGNRWDECSTGIHFFLNRQEAINYC